MISKVDARAGDYLEVALSSVDEGMFLVDTSDFERLYHLTQPVSSPLTRPGLYRGES